MKTRRLDERVLSETREFSNDEGLADFLADSSRTL